MEEERRATRTPRHSKPSHFPARTKKSDLDSDLDDLRSSLGATVRRLRVDKGLSMRALASSVGVTSSFVSQLEHGQVMPSVASLVRLAGALDVKVGELFETSSSPGEVLRYRDRTFYDYPNLGIRDEVISLDPTDRLEVMVGYVSPGCGTGAELYAHGADTEFVLVVRGTLEVVVGDETHVLEHGDSLTFSGNIPHGYSNPGDVMAEVIWVMTPASF